MIRRSPDGIYVVFANTRAARTVGMIRVAMSEKYRIVLVQTGTNMFEAYRPGSPPGPPDTTDLAALRDVFPSAQVCLRDNETIHISLSDGDIVHAALMEPVFH